MKSLILVITLLTYSLLMAEDKDVRTLIGPTVHGPIKYNSQLYFLSTTGILYSSDLKIEKLKNLYKTKQVTVSPLSLDGQFVYFGDGLHDQNESHLYQFDLKQKKINKELKITGHVQREIAFSKELVFAGLGIGGIAAFDKNLNLKWQIKEVNKKALHVDSNPILYKDYVCVASVYSLKALLCFNQSDGKLVKTFEMSEDPKSELGISQNLLYGFSTSADMMKSKFDIKSTLYVIDLDQLKQVKTLELRGYNFFKAPLVDKEHILVNISTGDILKIKLLTGEIEYVGEFPEPFVSTPFILKNDFCSIGIMGKLLCYRKGKLQYHITKDKRYFESPVGSVSVIDGNVYIPNRRGYFILR